MAKRIKKIGIKISQMTGKMLNVDAINTDPLANEFCMKMNGCSSAICSKCYSINMLLTFRKSCRPAWERNANILSEKVLSDEEVATIRFKNELVRFNAHGELINVFHAINAIKIAAANPTRKFGLFTKRANLVIEAIDTYFNGEVPANLRLIYSAAKLNTKARLPKYFHKVFTVYARDFETDAVINCCDVGDDRHCNDCRRCYEVNDVTEVNERVKAYTK